MLLICKQMMTVGTLLLSAGLLNSALADTITVCLDGTCDFTDPAAAADIAVTGDTIDIAAGTYLLDAPVIVYGQNIHVRGEVDSDGRPAVILDGQGATTVINTLVLTDQSTFENLIVMNGFAEYGGGMFLFNSDPVFRNCIIRDNHAEFEGGGLFMNHGSSPTFIGCEIINNTASHPVWDSGHGAAVRVLTGKLTLVDTLVAGNTAEIGGGAIAFNSDTEMVLERSRICGNESPDGPQVWGSGVVTNLGGCIEDDCDVCVTTVPTDLNFDGSVNVVDLLLLLEMWGGSGSGDIDDNGIVDVVDLLLLIAAWN
jgi:hypothetical protein